MSDCVEEVFKGSNFHLREVNQPKLTLSTGELFTFYVFMQ